MNNRKTIGIAQQNEQEKGELHKESESASELDFNVGGATLMVASNGIISIRSCSGESSFSSMLDGGDFCVSLAGPSALIIAALAAFAAAAAVSLFV